MLLDAVTLNGTYNRGGTFHLNLQGCDLLQWAVGLQQGWQKLSVLKAEIVAQC